MKKLNVLLPMLAFILAIAGAYASGAYNQVKYYEPDHFKMTSGSISCVPCEPNEDNPCVTLVQDRRCQCMVVFDPKIAYNSACQSLWRWD